MYLEGFCKELFDCDSPIVCIKTVDDAVLSDFGIMSSLHTSISKFLKRRVGNNLNLPNNRSFSILL